MNQPTNDIFQAIADPSRRQILLMLSKDSMSINAIAENFSMSRPAVSKHIKLLQTSGFIIIEDRGRERYCTLGEKGFEELKGWITYFDNFWKEKGNALGKLLNERHPVKGKK